MPDDTPTDEPARRLRQGELTYRDVAANAWYLLRWPAAVIGALVAVALVGGIWLWTTTDLPEASAMGESAVLLDRNGDELAVLAQDGRRIEIPLDEMGPDAVNALVAAEDQRFYDHDGVDPIGIGRALWNNLTDDDLEGGSTITQQLVKNAYLTSDRTITRKVREAVLSVKLERTVSKDDILERYLNTVYFGRGAYGIEAAASVYFDTSAAKLTPGQSAFLVGILRSPEALDPATDPDAAQERRNAVLDTMVSMGTLEADVAEKAKQSPIEVVPEPSPTTLSAGVAPHFVEQVRAELIEQFGEQALYDRGLVVHTTLDIADQKAAEKSVATHLDDPADPQAAVVGIERSGAVRAWVGGRDFEELQVDLVSGDGSSGRQPGSTFKPLVLTANFEAGYGAGQEFAAPEEITIDIPPEPWTVQNAGGAGYGTLSLFEATVNSVNTVYAQALAQVGPEPVVDVARRMGIDRELDPQPSIALGTEEVSPLELANVFSTFARSGERVDPFRISKVEDRDGEVLWEREEVEPERAIEANVADTVSHILSEVPRRGTATRAALDRPMAAKTGTTQQNADAWLAGYTPEYTAVVWMGDPDGTDPMEPVDGQPVFGGSIPAMIWHDFMAVALEDVAPTEFPPPDPELLEDPSDDAALTVNPAQVAPGGTVTVSGTGFELCTSDWRVRIDGPTSTPAPDEEASTPGNGNGRGNETAAADQDDAGVPFSIESASDAGSESSERSAQLTIPSDAAEGTYAVQALCDNGSGLSPYGAGATLTVSDGDPSATTTTTSSTTTTTEPDETTTTTTTSTTTTTTTTPTTTTTEAASGGSTTTTTSGAAADADA